MSNIYFALIIMRFRYGKGGGVIEFFLYRVALSGIFLP